MAALLLIFLAVSAIVIIAGATYQPTEGWLAVVLADDLALLWITAVSFVHLLFVPAFCTAVALRDKRRKQAGIDIPGSRSVWVGHESVFGDDGEGHRRGA